MRILEVKLINFRQFIGENTLNFTSNEKGSISLVFGTNGGGKTTILSAMHWCLHGTAPYISNPNNLANENLFKGLKENEELALQVTMTLNDGGRDYLVTRKRVVSKQLGNEIATQNDELTFTDLEGVSLGNPQFEVNQRFPQKFANFFFVPGESIEDFFKAQSMAALIENIKDISEIGSYENAILLAEKIEAKLLKNISEFSSSSEVATARDAIETLRIQFSNLSSSREHILDSIRIETNSLEKLRNELGDIEEFDAIEEKVDQLQSEIRTIQSDIDICDRETKKILKTRGFLAFTDSMEIDLEASLGLIGLVKSSDNVIPTQVLITLSRREECVCGHTISDIERENIESLIHSHAELDSSLGSNLNFRQLPSEFSFTNLKISLETYLNRLAHLRVILSERKSQMASLLDTEGNFGSRNSTFKELKSKQIAIQELQGEAEAASERIQQIEVSLKANEVKLASLIEKDSMQAKIGEDRDSIVRVKDHLSKTLANYRTSFRDELTSELNALVQEFIFDPVKVDLGEDFQFDLIGVDNGQSFGGGGGQNKAKAMAMIIALYRIASRRISKGESIDNNGIGSFPLIIDSAFGELGLELRNRVANEITREAGQSIFFVSETQAQGVVDSVGESSISSKTLLHSFVTGHGTNQVEPLILGKKVTWITFNSDRKRTEIEDLI